MDVVDMMIEEKSQGSSPVEAGYYPEDEQNRMGRKFISPYMIWIY